MEGISIIDTFVIEKTIKNIIEKLLINQQIFYLKYVKIQKKYRSYTMKQFFKIIILLLGGLLIMLGLSACGERIPENRTKEQYELEK